MAARRGLTHVDRPGVDALRPLLRSIWRDVRATDIVCGYAQGLWGKGTGVVFKAFFSMPKTTLCI